MTLLLLINRRTSSIFLNADGTHRTLLVLFIRHIGNDSFIGVSDIGHTRNRIRKTDTISTLIQHMKLPCVLILF